METTAGFLPAGKTSLRPWAMGSMASGNRPAACIRGRAATSSSSISGIPLAGASRSTSAAWPPLTRASQTAWADSPRASTRSRSSDGGRVRVKRDLRVEKYRVP